MQNMTSVIKIFDNVEIVAGGTALSSVIDLTLSGGNFSLQLEVTGDGTLQAEKVMSNNGADFLAPEGDVPFLSGITKTSGPGSDGLVIEGFAANVAEQMKILLTETGVAETVTVSGWLAVQ